MRKYNLIGRIALTALLAGSLMAGQSQAKSDFEALLAEVDFGASAATVSEPTLPSASDAVQALADPVDVASDAVATPAAQAMTMPAQPEPLPIPQAAETVAAGPSIQSGAAGACCNQCGTQCGKKCRLTGLKQHDFVQEGFCQPYTPPQVPTSTFYQYWRSNACNVHVWDGFQNRCHSHIDLSIHGKGACGGCDNGSCGSVHSSGGDCGPVPAEWCGKPACEACDAR